MNKLENSIIQKESKLIFKIAQHNAVKKKLKFDPIQQLRFGTV